MDEGSENVDETTPPPAEGLAMADPVTHTRTSSTGFLLDALRTRPAGRALLSTLTTVLFLAGAGMFAYPIFTDVYTTNVVQNRLADQFEEIEVASFEEWEATITGETGRVLTKMVIPKLGVETLVVEGTSPAALRAGAGHYPNTPLPGQAGNIAIAGHRTTYGRPFNRVDELRAGDEVWLITPVGDYRYVVSPTPDGWKANPLVTSPKDWTVIDQSGGAGLGGGARTAAGTPAESFLTLTTCHPKGSAAQRLVVRAYLDEAFPAGYHAAEIDTTA